MRNTLQKMVFKLSAARLVMMMIVMLLPGAVSAINILEYKDTLSDSGPLEQSNHTLEFVLNTDVSADSVFEITPPAGFEVVSTSTFAERNFELWVDGLVRSSALVATSGIDKVEIVTGVPGFFRYTLAPDYTISSGSRLQFKIGNHTTMALSPVTTFSTSTGTTTTSGDVEPVINSEDVGVHRVAVEVYDGGLVANADFVIFLNEKVNVPNVDTTETVPPFRFNGSPTSTVGGTTLSVEISLQTDEFSVCKYSVTAGTSYASMSDSFANTGLVYHSQVVSVTANALNQFYVRCIDDEGNFNIDDYVIAFSVSAQPTGIANTEGDVSGDGTGSGNDGDGAGSGAGGEEGAADGVKPLDGDTTGTGGGSGGGGGGGSGGSSGGTAGGGFEASDEAYRSGDGRVIISGFAFPDSEVGILVDGNFIKTVTSNGEGSYSVTLGEIGRGVYTFGVYAEGPDEIRSSTFSTSFTVTGARTTSLSNINVTPSIKVDPDPVQPGESLVFSGYTLPEANVVIENGVINKSSTQDLTTISDDTGYWTTTAGTQGFSVDTYQVRAKSSQEGGRSTNFSEYTFYGVGQAADVPINADLNQDGKVNLIDFSILLFWWNTDGGDSDPSADINQDDKVSLTDFSILLFNWTG